MRTLVCFLLLSVMSPIANANASGCVRGNCVNGDGHMIWDDGSEYEGYFVKSEMDGQGTYTWQLDPNIHSKRYTGSWRKGAMDGKGTFEYTDGRVYTGWFKDNKITGLGVLRNDNGMVTETGYWENGVLLRSEIEMKREEQRLHGLRQGNNANSRIINAIKFALKGDSAKFHSTSIPLDAQNYAFANCEYHEWEQFTGSNIRRDGPTWWVTTYDLNKINWESLQTKNDIYSELLFASCDGKCFLNKRHFVIEWSGYERINFKPMPNIGRTYNAINDIKSQCPGYSSPY